MNLKLAEIARQEAAKCYHGNVLGAKTNLQPIADLFPTSPTWQLENWENCWCAGFVYFCCVRAGIELPVRYPDERVTCNFGGCFAWEQWAKLPEMNRWRAPSEKPEIGDIVLFDHVFLNQEHDHIAVIVGATDWSLTTAEGNFNNVSAIVTREMDEHIRGYVRM